MRNVFFKLKQIKLQNRVLAAVLACTVVLSSASAVMLPLVNRPKAAVERPGTAAYYTARWEEAKTRFGKVEANTAYTDYQGNPETVAIEGPWMLDNLKDKVDSGELSVPWNGVAAGTAPTETENGGTYNISTNPYLVYTAEELRYCMRKRFSFKLMKDIDLAGYTNRNWVETTGDSTVWIADGNGHTIYNLYTTGSAFFGANTAMVVKHLRFSNSYVNCKNAYTAVFFGADGSPSFYEATIQNCAIETSWVYGGSGTGGFSSGSRIKGIYTSYVKDIVVYGSDHVAATVSYDGVQEISNSFAADSVVISTGSHSGGFASCSTSAIYTNNFSSNVDMYCNREAGNFYSTSAGGSTLAHISNCFSSGKMEGMSNLGGFLGGDSSAHTYVTNCYTTTMTGMVSGASNMGSFVGSGNIYGGTVDFVNCYAAGETGSIDTIVTPDRTTYTTVGGFTGLHNARLTYDNCYYDKQTTAMREWETGTTLDGGAGDIAGIKGMLTTTTATDGVGMTDAGWNALGDAYNTALGDGFYPQLTVFSNPTTFTGFKGWITDEEVQELVKACSIASVSTVQMNTWEKDYNGNDLPRTTYDTVRDIVSEFSLSSGQGTVPETEKEFLLPGGDVALGKQAVASSVYDDSYVANKVTDGNTDTVWCNANGSSPHTSWIYVDLGNVREIEKISVNTPIAQYLPTEYELQISDDANTWTTVCEQKDVTQTGYQHAVFDTPISARYVKLQMIQAKHASYVEIGTIEVYASPTSYTVKYPAYDYAVDGWERCGVTGQGTLNTGTGAQSGVNFGESLNPEVIQLVKRGDEWYGNHPMPGIDWVRVTTSVNGQKGHRSLRICPTVGIDAGLSQYVGDHIPYDHADDVRLAFSTGARMDKGDQYITYGVFPDDPLADKQKAFLENSDLANVAALITKFAEAGQNNAFFNVDVAHMERTTSAFASAPTPINGTSGVINEVIIRPVLSENQDGSLTMGEPVDLTDPNVAARWNGEKDFSDGSRREIFDIEYVWSLTDGRFLLDSKRVEAAAYTHSLTIRVENQKGDEISDEVYLDAYSISDGAGSVNPDAAFNFGQSTKAQDKLDSQHHAHPAAAAWKVKDESESIQELRIKMTAVDETLFHEVTIPASELPTPEEPSKTIKVIAPYRSYTRDSHGNTIWRLNELEKEYTITLDQDGVYNIIFNLEYEDYKSGVFVDDMDMDIEVVVVLDSYAVELHKLEKLPDGTLTNTPVPGAAFYLFTTDGRQIGGRYVSNAQGKIPVHLSKGDYYFEEADPGPSHIFDTDENGQRKTRYPFTVTGDSTQVTIVTAYNVLLEGSLAIRKIVQNADDSPLTAEQEQEPFEFTVTFSDGGTYSYRIDGGDLKTVASGGKLYLKHGQAAVFENIPVDVSHNVTETPKAGYIISGSDTTEDGNVVSFVNTYDPSTLPPTGSLTVSKEVQGQGADLNKEFTFTAVIGGVTHTFSLKHGESHTFPDLPVGTAYTVTETEYTDEGYIDTVRQYTGTITGQEALLLPFVNVYDDNPDEPDKSHGSLEIAKEVVGENPDPDKEFTFEVTFSDGGTYFCRIDGGELKQIPSGGTITLKQGQTAVFEDIPHSVAYTVRETDAGGYLSAIETADGVIAGGETAALPFQNRVPEEPKEPGKITVTKVLAGEYPQADKDKEFHFTLIVGSVETPFTLKPGETKEFEVPPGVQYVVREEDYSAEGYRQSVEKGFGTVVAGVIETVVTNTFVGTVMVEIPGEKTWDLTGYPESVKPDSITVRLMEGGRLVEEKTVSPDENGRWLYNFTAPKYDADGNEIAYTVEEAPLPGFLPAYDGYSIRNTYLPPVSIDPPILQKVVKGDPAAPGTRFEFLLNGSPGAPMPEGSTGNIRLLTMEGGGQLELGRITFDRTGIYTYTVTEVNGGIRGWRYDGAVYTLTVTVTEENGKLVPHTLLTRDGETADTLLFTNTFSNTPTDNPGGSQTGDTNGPDSPGVPQTGDTLSVWPWLALMFASLTGIVCTVILARRQGKPWRGFWKG